MSYFVSVVLGGKATAYMATSSLQAAKTAKNDEFYTQLPDIENELKHYVDQLKDKVILCNCDDPFESNFFKYFAMNFKQLGLKKLLATSYKPSPISGKQLPLFEMEGLKDSSDKEPYAVEINEVPDMNNDGAISMKDVELLLRHNKNASYKLNGDDKYPAGDFRSDECVELLKRSDVVVTNPPFSLYRQYITQLMEHDKQFLIIGDDNWVSLKETFALLQDNKMWKGYGRVKEFRQPDGNMKKFGNKCWYTNLDVAKRHEFLTLYKKYTAAEYQTYANFDAIEVSRVENIPEDFDGLMGVPITFLDKYNPEQFEIVGSSRNLGKKMSDCGYPKGSYVQGGVRFYLPIVDNERERVTSVSTTELSSGERYRRLYDRIVIRKRKVKDGV